MDTLVEDTLIACQQYGAYTVRKAAVRAQKDGFFASLELSLVGLAGYGNDYKNALVISHIAFDQMTPAEQMDFFISTMNLTDEQKADYAKYFSTLNFDK